ncbi:MAG: HEPN domain-containing protein [Candidatus Omnitrophica bacterium]|nr:HEPN domain-containing protein [Candidatus Omnitrophota bacterium]
MNKETKNWLEMVEYDITTAKQMFKTGRYVYVIFMCHLAIEKALKAIVCEDTNRVPPKTHDLIHLINMGQVKLQDDLLDFVGMINSAGVVTRYPEDLSRLISSYPKQVAKKYLDKTVEVIKCIKQNTRLKK